jgi:hypothetical protein
VDFPTFREKYTRRLKMDDYYHNRSYGYRGRTPKYKNPRRHMTHARGAQAPVNGMPTGHYLPVQKRNIETHYD